MDHDLDAALSDLLSNPLRNTVADAHNASRSASVSDTISAYFATATNKHRSDMAQKAAAVRAKRAELKKVRIENKVQLTEAQQVMTNPAGCQMGKQDGDA